MNSLLVFDIAAFSHRGTIREENEDHILINGLLGNEGLFFLTSIPVFHCFVADGVGGNKGGAFASHFILNRIQKSIIADPEPDFPGILHRINNELIDRSSYLK